MLILLYRLCVLLCVANENRMQFYNIVVKKSQKSKEMTQFITLPYMPTVLMKKEY